MVHMPCRPLAIEGELLALRPIRKDDADRLQTFMKSLSAESRYFRFLDAIRELPPQLLRCFVEVDFTRDMALAVVQGYGESDERVIAVGRYFGDEDSRSCEFALAVSDAWQHHGLGHHLMSELLASAASHGYQHIHGDVLAENSQMLKLMRHLGFAVRSSTEDPTLRVVERQVGATV